MNYEFGSFDVPSILESHWSTYKHPRGGMREAEFSRSIRDSARRVNDTGALLAKKIKSLEKRMSNNDGKKQLKIDGSKLVEFLTETLGIIMPKSVKELKTSTATT